MTNDKAIENRALEVYSKRLEGNKMLEDLKDLEETTIKLCETRLKVCKTKVTDPWDMEDLQYVIKNLKKNMSRDADGFANELFMLKVAGDDLLLAVFKLLNKIKDKQGFPDTHTKLNIPSIHKLHSQIRTP